MNTKTTLMTTALLALLVLAPAPATAYATANSGLVFESAATDSPACEDGVHGPCVCEYPESNGDPRCPQCDAECEEEYCAAHPTSHVCTGEMVKCDDGFYGWDTDGDGTCDNDDLDDDNDGVPDRCDGGDGVLQNAIDQVMYLLSC